jgi:hypothetical protein
VPRRRRNLAIVLAVLAALAVAVIGVTTGTDLLRPRSPMTALGAPHYIDETATAGIDFTHDSQDIRFVTGGGVAILDCNGDGKPDVYLAGGSGPAALYRNDSPVGGALRFSRLQDDVTGLADVMGAYPIDIDGDGLTDLAVLRVGENVLLRGLGDCRFERANERWSFDGGDDWAAAFSAKWEGSADLPTLAIGNYRNLDPQGQPGDGCADNALFRPDAAGGGYGPPLVLTPGYCTLSMLFSDWDRSGRRDLRVSNDRQYYTDGEEQLWRVAAGEAPSLYTAADGWVSMQIWGMGIASQDLTGDGLPEVFLTSQGDNRLQTLTVGPDHPTYRDIALRRGVTAAQPFTGGDVLPSTAWHPEFEDVNNDGFEDLFISKGNVSTQAGYAVKDPSNLFLGQPDGTFVEAAEQAGVLSFARGRGAALADFNLDGLLDLIELNLGDPVKVWRNAGSGDGAQPAPMGNWLALRVAQDGPNRDAIGAWLEIKVGDLTINREVTIGGGHAGGQLGWIHVGLGRANQAQVRVQWPDGEWGPTMEIAADQFATIQRGASAPTVWATPAP